MSVTPVALPQAATEARTLWVNATDASQRWRGDLREFGERRKLVQRFACGISQPFYLVLDHQFPALQFDNPHIVRGEVHESFMQFVFKNFVFPFQFNEMRLNCHTKPPRLIET